MSLSFLPAGTMSLPFWSCSGPWKTLNFPDTIAFFLAAICAFVFAVTFGPYGARLVNPSLIVP